MNASPDISVIMPVYNEEKYLEKSLISILDQTYQNFEFIIIDDGSSDKSIFILERYAQKDKRIKIIKNKTNLGVAKSLNRGLSTAKGKYIARHDADDIALPSRLKVQYQYLKKNKDIFLVGSAAIIIDEEGRELGVMAKKDNYKKLRKILKKTNTIIHPSIMFRNKGNLFYNPQALWCEDYEFYLRLLNEGKRLTNISKPLLKYRIHSRSASSQKGAIQELIMEKIRRSYRQAQKISSIEVNKISVQQSDNYQAYFYQRMIKFYLKINNRQQAKKYYQLWRQTKQQKLILKISFSFFIHFPFLYRFYRNLFFGY